MSVMVFVLILLWSNLAHSEFTELIDISLYPNQKQNITPKVLYALGSDKQPASEKFKPIEKDELKINYTNDYIWMKVTLQNRSTNPVSRVLKIQHTMAGEIIFYNQFGVNISRTGSAVNWNERPVKSYYPVLQLELPPGQTQEIFIRRHSHHRFDARMILTNMDQLKQIDNRIDTIVLVYSGALFALLIYNLFLGLYTGKRVYLYYSAFVTSMGLLSLNMQGALDKILTFLPFTPSNYLMQTSSGAGLLALIFTKRFLKWQPTSTKVIRFYQFLLIGLGAHFFLFPLLRPLVGAHMGNTVDVFIALTLITLLTIGVKSALEKQPLAYFYILSWTGVFAGAFVWFGMYYNIFPNNLITQTSLLWGNMIEMVVISLGLAYQITILDKEKERARLDAVGKEKYQTLARVLLHDIVTPLTLILNHNKKLTKPDVAEERKEKSREVITRATNIILKIIETVKKQESESLDELVEQTGPIQLKEAMDDCLFLYQQRLQEKNIEVQMPEKFPNILAEKVLLTNHVLSNIISNAIKFSPPNSKIKIETSNGNGEVKISIRDYGHGIHKSELNLFQSRGVIKSKEGTLGEKGTGYGMLLMKSFVKAMNGKVDIESVHENETDSKDHGTTVTLTFPAA